MNLVVTSMGIAKHLEDRVMPYIKSEGRGSDMNRSAGSNTRTKDRLRWCHGILVP